MRKLSSNLLRKVNALLKEENMKICSETELLLPISCFGKRNVNGKEYSQPYSIIARKTTT